MELYQRQRERATEGEKSSERGQRQRANATQHRARLKISAFLGFFSAWWYSRRVERQKANTRDFYGFAAHGLKARNGSRTRQGSPKADRKRSRAGATTENTHTVNHLVNLSENQIPRCAYVRPLRARRM